MRKVLVAAALCVLAACSDTTTDADACRVFSEVDEQIAAFDPSAALDEAETERNRQWEFRLAQASVMATDHDLSVALRDIAYKASFVAAGQGSDAYEEDAPAIRDMCR